MSTQGLAQLYTQSFSTNLRLRLQQRGSRLRGLVMEGAHVGKEASPVDYMAATQTKAVQGRFQPIEFTDNDYQRRWVLPQSRDLAQPFDTFDKLKTLEDPQSQAVQNGSNAMGRDWDDALIAAAFATATIGSSTDGTSTTTETFSTASYGISEKFGDGSTAVGMTVDKMIEAVRIFEHNHVDIEDMEGEPRTLVIGSTQRSNLLKLTEVVSREFNDRPALVDGQVVKFLGWNIKGSERLKFGTGIGGSSNTRQCIAFVKSGIYLGIWQDMYWDVYRDKRLQGHPWIVYGMHTFGATRLEPGRLLRIDCANDSVGNDITA